MVVFPYEEELLNFLTYHNRRRHYHHHRFSLSLMNVGKDIKQESPADARVTRDSAISFQDGGCSKMAVSRHLGYYRTGYSAIRTADPENPCLEPDMEWIGCTVCEIFAFKLYCDLETGVRSHSRSLKVAQ